MRYSSKVKEIVCHPTNNVNLLWRTVVILVKLKGRKSQCHICDVRGPPPSQVLHYCSASELSPLVEAAIMGLACVLFLNYLLIVIKIPTQLDIGSMQFRSHSLVFLVFNDASLMPLCSKSNSQANF